MKKFIILFIVMFSLGFTNEIKEVVKGDTFTYVIYVVNGQKFLLIKNIAGNFEVIKLWDRGNPIFIPR